ncbi:MAG TPA: polysaccharide deacetylase family protein [Pyrinomonadaceae bacterium]
MRYQLLLCMLVFITLLTAEESVVCQTKTVAERLGYPADARLVIVHADDLGMSHSINEASIKAFSSGLVNSGSIMMPCSWVPEIAAYARANPQADLGLHLTLTSEWQKYRWRPLLAGGSVQSLLDADGYLYLTESEAASHLNVVEAEKEIRAQIERANKLGIRPTHLDSHMGTLYQTKELFEMFVRVARENKLPIRVAKDMAGQMPFLSQILKPEDILIDNTISIEPSVTAEGWANFYIEGLKKLNPGVTEIVIHLAYDDAEMKAVTFEHPNWGAAWRQRDFDFFTSNAFRKLLEENHIKLITYRDLQKLQYGM